jgi:hypothetical protein
VKEKKRERNKDGESERTREGVKTNEETEEIVCTRELMS